MRIVSAAKGQWLIREFPELSNCLQQTIQSDLTILHCPSDAVFNDSTLEVDCFSGRRRQLNPCGVFEDPSDFFEICNYLYSKYLPRRGLEP
jgi:hypothetical protein